MQIRRIVLDTNVFGQQPEPDLGTIRRWASACVEHDAELWLPTVVAWELAQHAVAADAEHLRELAAINKRRARWGSDPLPLPRRLSVEAVLARIVESGAMLIDTPPEAAVEALMDQILLRGAGARKKGVKTGAADSAWVHAVVEHEDYEDGDGVIVVSGDAEALELTCEMIGVDPPRRVAHLGELQELLDETVDATAQQAIDFEVYVRTQFANDHDGAATLLSLAQADRRNRWNDPLDQLREELWEVQGDASFEVIEQGTRVVGQVSRDGWTESLTGRIEVTLRVTEQLAKQDNWGADPEFIEAWYDVRVTANLTVSEDLNAPLEFDGFFDDLAYGHPEDIEFYRI